jgi:hypothetical protein
MSTPDRDLAGDDRRRHRSRRQDHRRASHLARPVGAARRRSIHPTRHGRSPRHAVRFGVAGDVMAAGEGIETMLSLRCACRPCRWRPRFRPRISPPSCSRPRCAVSISSATTIRPVTARRRSLIARAETAGIEAIAVSPTLGRLQRGSPHSGIDALGHRCGFSSPRRTSSASCIGVGKREGMSPGGAGQSRSSGGFPAVGEDRDHGLLRGRSAGKRPARQWLRPAIFRRRRLQKTHSPGAMRPRFASRSKIAGPRHPPLRFGPPLAPGAGPVRPPAFVATKAAMGAADPTKEHP